MKAIDWTEQLVGEICGLVSTGSAICEIAGKNGLPSEPAIYRRMATDKDFASRMSEARAAQQDFEADYCIKLADHATMEDWQVVKLQIWARQWRASKLAPKKYGDKQEVELSGQVEHTHLTLEELKARITEARR